MMILDEIVLIDRIKKLSKRHHVFLLIDPLLMESDPNFEVPKVKDLSE